MPLIMFITGTICVVASYSKVKTGVVQTCINVKAIQSMYIVLNLLNLSRNLYLVLLLNLYHMYLYQTDAQPVDWYMPRLLLAACCGAGGSDTDYTVTTALD